MGVLVMDSALEKEDEFETTNIESKTSFRSMEALSISKSSASLHAEELPLEWHTIRFSVKAAIIAGLGGLLFGYDIGVVSGALKLLEKDFSLSNWQLELVVSLMTLGAVLGSAVGGAVCDAIGRKTTILLTNVIFVVGGITMFFATNIVIIYVGRIILGIGIAISAIADISYLNEVAPVRVRGAVVSANEAMVTVGVLLSYLVDYALRDTPGGWRWMFGAAAGLALFQAAGMRAMPESPRWLLAARGDRAAARRALAAAYPTDHQVRMQIVIIETTQHQAQMATGTNLGLLSEWRYQFGIVIVLMIFQQLSGNSNLLNYAEEIFEQGGVSNASFGLVIIGIVKVIFTGTALTFVDKVGRKILLCAGSLVMAASFSVIAFAFMHTEAHPLLILICSCVIVAAYAISFGPLIWLVTSESFPTKIKGRAIGIALVANWLGNFAAASTFLTFLEVAGAGATFGLHALACTGAAVFAILVVPETRGKDPEDVAMELANGGGVSQFCCCWKRKGCHRGQGEGRRRGRTGRIPASNGSNQGALQRQGSSGSGILELGRPQDGELTVI